jgi:hypothetical protein
VKSKLIEGIKTWLINAQRESDCRCRAALSRPLEGIHKLVHSGSSPEDISFVFKINIETIQQIIAKDPMHRTRVVQSIKERSAKYRCAQSNRLMISPVMACDENFYEQSILENDPSLSKDKFIQSKKLKTKIEDFSKESLRVLEG